MILATFLETCPLYKWVALEPSNDGSRFKLSGKFPSINMPCSICKSNQTFCTDNKNPNKNSIINLSSYQFLDYNLYLEVYECANYHTFAHCFMIKEARDGNSIMKVGQHPNWSIEVESYLEKALGRHVREYKNGLINEGHGFGIGAFAYYRRIVEVMIDELLADILELIPSDDKQHQEYREALERAKDDHRADVKIAQVKDLIPAVLRPGGANPLKELHSALSAGLHGHTDEECLDLADHIRVSLKFLIERSRSHPEQFVQLVRITVYESAASDP